MNGWQKRAKEIDTLTGICKNICIMQKLKTPSTVIEETAETENGREGRKIRKMKTTVWTLFFLKKHTPHISAKTFSCF